MGCLLDQNKVIVFSLMIGGIHRWVCKRLKYVFNSSKTEFPLVSGTVSSLMITLELSPFR